MPLRIPLLAACALILAVPATAQVTFKSGVDLVRLDVRVVDEAGRPVTDLKAEEVVIEEWTYNLGPHQLIRVVRLENGYVADIKRLGYGY